MPSWSCIALLHGRLSCRFSFSAHELLLLLLVMFLLAVRSCSYVLFCRSAGARTLFYVVFSRRGTRIAVGKGAEAVRVPLRSVGSLLLEPTVSLNFLFAGLNLDIDNTLIELHSHFIYRDSVSRLFVISLLSLKVHFC